MREREGDVREGNEREREKMMKTVLPQFLYSQNESEMKEKRREEKKKE